MKFVGATDTIVQRIGAPINSPSGTFNLTMQALQLMSVNTFDPDGAGPLGIANYFITLAPNTLSSMIDVFYDLRAASVTGPIVSIPNLPVPLTLTGSNSPWSHNSPPFAVLVPSVNFGLKGSDTSTDFFPAGVVHEVHPVASHDVRSTIPEPGTVAFGVAVSVAAAVQGVSSPKTGQHAPRAELSTNNPKFRVLNTEQAKDQIASRSSNHNAHVAHNGCAHKKTKSATLCEDTAKRIATNQTSETL